MASKHGAGGFPGAYGGIVSNTFSMCAIASESGRNSDGLSMRVGEAFSVSHGAEEMVECSTPFLMRVKVTFLFSLGARGWVDRWD